jgi:lambda repressor-like predicted transcriptional regulator
MALFFDTEWFDAALAERGLSRAVLAVAAGLSEADLALVYKDQRELSLGEVAAFAEILGVSSMEIASRAGISTPSPRTSPIQGANDRLTALERRVAELEAEVARLRGA